MGRSDIDASRQLLCMKGIWLCRQCGGYSSGFTQKSSPRLLRLPCRGSMARAGRGVLRRLARGLPPKPGVRWPLPHDFTGQHACRAAVNAGVRINPQRRLRYKQPLLPAHSLDEPDGQESLGGPEEEDSFGRLEDEDAELDEGPYLEPGGSAEAGRAGAAQHALAPAAGDGGPGPSQT